MSCVACNAVFGPDRVKGLGKRYALVTRFPIVNRFLNQSKMTLFMLESLEGLAQNIIFRGIGTRRHSISHHLLNVAWQFVRHVSSPIFKHSTAHRVKT